MAVLITTALSGPARADDHGIFGQNGDEGTSITGQEDGSESEGSDSDGSEPGTGPAGYVPQNWTQERLVPACMQSGIGKNEDVMCAGMTMSCPEGQSRWRVYTRLMSPTGEPLSDWVYEGTRCEGGDTSGGVQTPTVTSEDVVDQAYAAAPVPDFTVQPGDTTYVNLPTNFVAEDDAPVTIPVTVLGIEVPVTFTPTSYEWSFGDGAAGSGAGVRNAAVGEPGAVEHAYGASGSYDITLTRVYTVSFTLPSGEPVSVPGEVSRTSDPYTLPVGEIQSAVTGVG